jgi:hypothetical protein
MTDRAMDAALADRIKKSLESDGFKSIPIDYRERRSITCTRRSCRMIGSEHIPPELRVEPSLDSWIER